MHGYLIHLKLYNKLVMDKGLAMFYIQASIMKIISRMSSKSQWSRKEKDKEQKRVTLPKSRSLSIVKILRMSTKSKRMEDSPNYLMTMISRQTVLHSIGNVFIQVTINNLVMVKVVKLKNLVRKRLKNKNELCSRIIFIF